MDELSNPIPQAQWQDYRTRLLRFVRSRVHDDVLSEDIVHDALVKAWLQKDKLHDEAAIVPWLFQITMNTIRDTYRRQSVHTLGDGVDEISDQVLDAETPFSTTYRQFAGCLSAMIDTLEPQNRETLVRSEIDGVPMREIAEELGLSVSAIKSRVQRSRAQVRDAMMACCKIEMNERGQITKDQDRDCSC